MKTKGVIQHQLYCPSTSLTRGRVDGEITRAFQKEAQELTTPPALDTLARWQNQL